MVHPHFEHAIIGRSRHAREAERHADVVIVALDRAVRLAGAEAVECGEQRFLRPRLARRAGDADDPRAAARARRDTERIKRRGAVRTAVMRTVDGGFAKDAPGTRSTRRVADSVTCRRPPRPRPYPGSPIRTSAYWETSDK